MLIERSLQKWGNSTAIRLPAKLLAASGIKPDSKVDIQSGDRQLIIQLKDKTQEALFDELLSDLPAAEDLIKTAQEKLSHAIELTDATTKEVQQLRKKLSGHQ